MKISHRREFLFSFVFLVAAFAFNVSKATADQLRFNKHPEELRFGVRSDTPPFSFREKSDSGLGESQGWRGYSVDLCKRIYREYAVEYSRVNGGSKEFSEPQFVEVTAKERFNKLADGQIDVLCGASTVTLERMNKVDFTVLTYLSGAAVMRRSGTKATLAPGKTPQDKTPVRVVYVSGTTTEDVVVNSVFNNPVHRMADTHFEAFRLLEAGEVDFYFADRAILEGLLSIKGITSGFDISHRFVSYEPYALAVTKRNDELLFVANHVLTGLYKGGEILAIFKNNFDDPPSQAIESMFQIFSFK